VGSRRRIWLTDDRDPEAGRGKGAGHRVQRPVPEAQQGGLAAEGVFLGPVRGREIVELAAGLVVHDGNYKGMLDGHEQPAAGLEHAPQLG
jgi:hypothetical protein